MRSRRRIPIGTGLATAAIVVREVSHALVIGSLVCYNK